MRRLHRLPCLQTYRASTPRGRFTLMLVASCVAGACSNTGPSTSCTGVPRMTVSAGLTPTISWQTGCPAIELGVYELTTGLTTWALRANLRPIPTPVTYGIVPVGVTEVHPAAALQPSIRYGVLLSVVVGTDTATGVQEFTP